MLLLCKQPDGMEKKKRIDLRWPPRRNLQARSAAVGKFNLSTQFYILVVLRVFQEPRRELFLAPFKLNK